MPATTRQLLSSWAETAMLFGCTPVDGSFAQASQRDPSGAIANSVSAGPESQGTYVRLQRPELGCSDSTVAVAVAGDGATGVRGGRGNATTTVPSGATDSRLL